MTTTNATEFLQNLEHYLDEVQERPIHIETQSGRNAVLVSADFYDRGIKALEDQFDDLEAARKAKTDTNVPFSTVLEHLGLDPNSL